MANTKFILQGFTSHTHATGVRRLFEVANPQHVVLSVAYVKTGGVELIRSELTANASKTTVLAGIRNGVTSRQGLGSLLDLGVELYTVDTGSRMLVFHPKLYYVRGDGEARVVIGSANLTAGGLNNNIEAGVALDLDMSVASDRTLAEAVEQQLQALLRSYPRHVVKVTSQGDLDDLLNSGRLMDEQAPLPPISGADVETQRDRVPLIKLRVPVLQKPVIIGPTPRRAKFVRVWESKPLTRRDLTIPTGANTHATGSINLDKGLLEDAIDQRHYFRDAVFDRLEWEPSRDTVEEAYGRFRLVIKGVNHGEFDLRIAHSTDRASRTYLQNNAMTRLSWGPMKPFIARDDLIGRALTLYRNRIDPTRFIIEID